MSDDDRAMRPTIENAINTAMARRAYPRALSFVIGWTIELGIVAYAVLLARLITGDWWTALGVAIPVGAAVAVLVGHVARRRLDRAQRQDIRAEVEEALRKHAEGG